MQVLADSGCDVALIREAPLCGDSRERERIDQGERICRLSNRADVIGFRNVPQGRGPGRRGPVSQSPTTPTHEEHK